MFTVVFGFWVYVVDVSSYSIGDEGGKFDMLLLCSLGGSSAHHQGGVTLGLSQFRQLLSFRSWLSRSPSG